MLISKFSNNNIEDKVAELERRYQMQLPVLYKKFLYKYNGGYTPNTELKVGRITTDVQGFFGIGDVDLSIDTIELEEWIEKSRFPIAHDFFGNIIAIGLRDDKSGRIYFCDHEKGHRATCVAENLQEFFQCCKSEKLSEKMKRPIKEREKALIAIGRGHIITDGLRQMWQDEIDEYENTIQEEVSL